MKRFGCWGVILMALLLCSTLKVQADVLWEPLNDFYEKHAQECETVATTYLANGEEGYITLYKSPQSDKKVAALMNGRAYYVGFTWTDSRGEVWAVVDFGEPTEGERVLSREYSDGWVPMRELAELYHEADFREEHAGELLEYQGELHGYEIQKTMQLWEYPGSSPTEVIYHFLDDEPNYEYLYTDPDGRRWTRISYYYGYKGWVCVDDPEETSLDIGYDPGHIEGQHLYPAKAPGEDALKWNPQNGSQSAPRRGLFLAVVPVGVLVVITAALIAVIFRKERKK